MECAEKRSRVFEAEQKGRFTFSREEIAGLEEEDPNHASGTGLEIQRKLLTQAIARIQVKLMAYLMRRCVHYAVCLRIASLHP
jgi:hypothetical protein